LIHLFIGHQALPCVEVAGCCFLGPGHKMTGCRSLGHPGAGGLQCHDPGIPGLVFANWWMKPGPWVSVDSMANQTKS